MTLVGFNQCPITDNQGWKYRLEIDKSIFSTFSLSNAKILNFFFHYRLGLFPTFLRGKSILIDTFFLNKFLQKLIFCIIFSTLSGFCGVCG